MHTTASRLRKVPDEKPAVFLLLVFLAVSAFCLTAATEGFGSTPGGNPPAGYAPAGANACEDLRLNKAYFRGFLHDAGSVVGAPLSWSGYDWLKFALITGAAIAVADDETDVQQWVQTRRDDNTHFVADLAEPMGNGKYALPALGALYLFGRVSGRDRARRAALLSFESVIISCGITGMVKYLAHKHRPLEASTDDIAWEGPSISTAYVSFPSGHSTCAFAIGTVLASEYRDNRLVPPLAYAAAALCAMSRMHDNAHWLSDVIIGSAIGHFTARTIVCRHSSTGGRGFSLVPSVRDNGPGLSLAYRF
jgi:membrane-associated phospholipid phosphatase